MGERLSGQGQVAVITGGGSGIGRGLAQALLGKGWRVAVMGRRVDRLEETIADHRENGLAVPLDVSDASAVANAFDQVVAEFGRIDLLFNNAGTFAGGGPVEDIDDDAWRMVVDVNLNGAFYCAQAAYRQMKAQDPQGGRIINNGSIASRVPRPNSIGYSATKHAITGMTKSLALEGRRYNIACGQIDIGNAATELAAAMPKGTLQADDSIKPEPMMDVSDVIDGLVYMAERPLSANVLDMTVMATAMPFVGRG